MQTVLLTGATGFLGAALAKALCARGDKVRALRRGGSSLARLQGFEDAIEWLNTDTADRESFEQFFAGIDAAIHTAATYGRSGQSVAEIVQTNLLYALKVLAATTLGRGVLFINTDSALPRETNAYTLSKAQFADWGRVLAANSRTRFLNVRLEHMYGPGDDEVKFVEHVVNACLGNQPAIALTTGTQQRDFIYISDVVDALLLLLDRQPPFINKYTDVSLGSGLVITIRELAEMIRRQTRSESKLAFGEIPIKADEVMYSCANIGTLAQLGWKPRVALEEGLRLTIESKRK